MFVWCHSNFTPTMQAVILPTLLFLQVNLSPAFCPSQTSSFPKPEPCTSGLEKAAPSGELEFSPRSNQKINSDYHYCFSSLIQQKILAHQWELFVLEQIYRAQHKIAPKNTFKTYSQKLIQLQPFLLQLSLKLDNLSRLPILSTDHVHHQVRLTVKLPYTLM